MSDLHQHFDRSLVQLGRLVLILLELVQNRQADARALRDMLSRRSKEHPEQFYPLARIVDDPDFSHYNLAYIRIDNVVNESVEAKSTTCFMSGRCKIVQEPVRPHVVRPNLESAYAEMAKDKKREKEATKWAEITFKDLAHETG
jgi:hypothetical protein